jgi:lysozyme
MRTSRVGTDLIRSFEGFRAHAVKLTDGRFLIGHGHTKSAREGAVISQEDALLLLKEYDLPPVERALNEWVLSPLNQNEFDALVSFAFNIGLREFRDSAVLAHLNAGEMLAAADAMLAWRKAKLDGRLIVVDALVRRRAAEMALFLEHPGGRPAAPGVLIRPRQDLSVLLPGLSERRPDAPAAPVRSATPDNAGSDEDTAPSGPPPRMGAATGLSRDEAAELSARIARMADKAAREAGVSATAQAGPEPAEALDAISRAIRELAEPIDGTTPAARPARAVAEPDPVKARPSVRSDFDDSDGDLPAPERAFEVLAREHARSVPRPRPKQESWLRRHIGALATILTGFVFVIWGLLDRLLYLPPAFTLSRSDFDPLPPLAVIGGVVTMALGIWSLLRGWLGTPND